MTDNVTPERDAGRIEAIRWAVTSEEGGWMSEPQAKADVRYILAEYDSLAAQLVAAQKDAQQARATLVKALRNSEKIEAQLEAAQKVIEAAKNVRTGLGLTAYEGTPISVISAKLYEKMLGDSLAAYDEQVKP